MCRAGIMPQTHRTVLTWVLLGNGHSKNGRSCQDLSDLDQSLCWEEQSPFHWFKQVRDWHLIVTPSVFGYSPAPTVCTPWSASLGCDRLVEMWRGLREWNQVFFLYNNQWLWGGGMHHDHHKPPPPCSVYCTCCCTFHWPPNPHMVVHSLKTSFVFQPSFKIVRSHWIQSRAVSSWLFLGLPAGGGSHLRHWNNVYSRFKFLLCTFNLSLLKYHY